jgi:hypothetical protein
MDDPCEYSLTSDTLRKVSITDTSPSLDAGAEVCMAYARRCEQTGYEPSILEVDIVLAHPECLDPTTYCVSSTERRLLNEYPQRRVEEGREVRV